MMNIRKYQNEMQKTVIEPVFKSDKFITRGVLIILGTIIILLLVLELFGYVHRKMEPFQDQNNNNKTVLAACDTFRAAAIDQLENWSKKVGSEIIKSEAGSDPASVAFKAMEYSKKNKCAISKYAKRGIFKYKKKQSLFSSTLLLWGQFIVVVLFLLYFTKL